MKLIPTVRITESDEGDGVTLTTYVYMFGDTVSMGHGLWSDGFDPEPLWILDVYKDSHIYQRVAPTPQIAEDMIATLVPDFEIDWDEFNALRLLEDRP